MVNRGKLLTRLLTLIAESDAVLVTVSAKAKETTAIASEQNKQVASLNSEIKTLESDISKQEKELKALTTPTPHYKEVAKDIAGKWGQWKNKAMAKIHVLTQEPATTQPLITSTSTPTAPEQKHDVKKWLHKLSSTQTPEPSQDAEAQAAKQQEQKTALEQTLPELRAKLNTAQQNLGPEKQKDLMLTEQADQWNTFNNDLSNCKLATLSYLAITATHIQSSLADHAVFAAIPANTIAELDTHLQEAITLLERGFNDVKNAKPNKHIKIYKISPLHLKIDLFLSIFTAEKTKLEQASENYQRAVSIVNTLIDQVATMTATKRYHIAREHVQQLNDSKDCTDTRMTQGLTTLQLTLYKSIDESYQHVKTVLEQTVALRRELNRQLPPTTRVFLHYLDANIEQYAGISLDDRYTLNPSPSLHLALIASLPDNRLHTLLEQYKHARVKAIDELNNVVILLAEQKQRVQHNADSSPAETTTAQDYLAKIKDMLHAIDLFSKATKSHPKIQTHEQAIQEAIRVKIETEQKAQAEQIRLKAEELAAFRALLRNPPPDDESYQDSDEEEKSSAQEEKYNPITTAPSFGASTPTPKAPASFAPQQKLKRHVLYQLPQPIPVAAMTEAPIPLLLLVLKSALTAPLTLQSFDSMVKYKFLMGGTPDQNKLRLPTGVHQLQQTLAEVKDAKECITTIIHNCKELLKAKPATGRDPAIHSLYTVLSDMKIDSDAAIYDTIARIKIVFNALNHSLPGLNTLPNTKPQMNNTSSKTGASL